MAQGEAQVMRPDRSIDQAGKTRHDEQDQQDAGPPAGAAGLGLGAVVPVARGYGEAVAHVGSLWSGVPVPSIAGCLDKTRQPFKAPCFIIAVRSGISGACPSRSEEHTSELQSLMRISYA